MFKGHSGLLDSFLSETAILELIKECSLAGCSIVFQTSVPRSAVNSCTNGVPELPASGAHNPALMQTSERARGTHGQEAKITAAFVGSRLTARSPRVPRTPGRDGCGPVEATPETEEGVRDSITKPGPSRLLAGGLRLHSAPRRPPAPLTDSIAIARQFLSLESSLSADPAPLPVSASLPPTSDHLSPRAEGGEPTLPAVAEPGVENLPPSPRSSRTLRSG